MKTSDFSYDLPENLIAQVPSQKRDRCRLLKLDRTSGSVSHHIFSDLPALLRPGDRLVLNDVKVIPARVFCRKNTGARIELLLLHPVRDGTWAALVKPLKRLKAGMILAAEKSSSVLFRVESFGGEGTVYVSLVDSIIPLEQVLETVGEVPLPPYVRREATREDASVYQTVYARTPGAVAAPTAGLHFTPELLDEIQRVGIGISFLTLNIGIGTFRPVVSEDPRKHPMHEETFTLGEEAVAEITHTREQGGRIVAVGTTVVRVLEHCAGDNGSLAPMCGSTRLLILPGYRFKLIDGLITNFHLPRSTLLMLVSAFASRESVLAAYAEAVRLEYRFFSYGDATLIL